MIDIIMDENINGPRTFSRRQVLGLGLGVVAGLEVATKIPQVLPPALEAIGRRLLQEQYSLEENDSGIIVTVVDAIGFGKATAELAKRRAEKDQRPFEIRCHKGKYLFNHPQDIVVPSIHPQKDKPESSFQTSAAIVLPDNTSLTAIDADVEFELPPSEVGLYQHITTENADVRIEGISFTSKGKVGHRGLDSGGVNTMLLIVGNDRQPSSGVVTIKNCRFNEQTDYDIYEPYKDYETDFRSGIVVKNVKKCDVDSVICHNPRWDGILGVNISDMTVSNSVIDRAVQKATLAGSAIALINRIKRGVKLTVRRSQIHNFRKCIGAFDGEIDVTVDNVQCSQEKDVDPSRYSWVFGGDDFNLVADHVTARGPMYKAFLVKTGEKPTRYKFTNCSFEIDNTPNLDEPPSIFYNQQVIDGRWNSVVTGENNEIRFRHHTTEEASEAFVLSRLPGFMSGVWENTTK